TRMLNGYQPGDPVVRVFTYQAAPSGSPEEIAEEAFAICNDHPGDAHGADLTRLYYERELRGTVRRRRRSRRRSRARRRAHRLDLVRGALNEVGTSEHGTHPLPAPARDGATPGEPP